MAVLGGVSKGLLKYYPPVWMCKNHTLNGSATFHSSFVKLHLCTHILLLSSTKLPLLLLMCAIDRCYLESTILSWPSFRTPPTSRQSLNISVYCVQGRRQCLPSWKVFLDESLPTYSFCFRGPEEALTSWRLISTQNPRIR